MRMLTALSIVALLAAPGRSQVSDGYFVEYFSGDLTTFPLDDPGTQAVLGSAVTRLVGLEFGVGGALLGLRDNGELWTIDPSDGSSTLLGAVSPLGGHIWTGLAFDETTGTLYASSTTGNSASALYTVDPGGPTATLVGQSLAAEALVDIGFDGAGHLYGHDLDGNDLNAIDETTGAMAPIGPLGFIGTGPWHGMDWDAASGTMYLFAHNGLSNDNELRPVDLTTGAAPATGSTVLPSGAFAIQAATPGLSTYCTAKTSSAGCVTSITTSAPLLGPVSGAGDYSVLAEDVHSFKNGLLFGGISGAVAIPFSGGLLCVGPPLKRGPILASGGAGANTCTGAFATLVNDGNAFPSGLDAGPGSSAWYQYWYRDPQNGAGQLGTALSDAVQLDFN